MYHLTMKTASDTESRGMVQLFYKCKSCGYRNELNWLSFSDDKSIIVSIVGKEEVHEYKCHKCDDVETMTIGLRESV
jgi:DNA-directed RNA polymerase subunit RPC12/RpoP